jgi:hypothetical protein
MIADILGGTVREMCEYLDETVPQNKIELIHQGMTNVFFFCILVGLIAGIPTGITIFLIVKRFVM